MKFQIMCCYISSMYPEVLPAQVVDLTSRVCSYDGKGGFLIALIPNCYSTTHGE